MNALPHVFLLETVLVTDDRVGFQFFDAIERILLYIFNVKNSRGWVPNLQVTNVLFIEILRETSSFRVNDMLPEIHNSLRQCRTNEAEQNLKSFKWYIVETKHQSLYFTLLGGKWNFRDYVNM